MARVPQRVPPAGASRLVSDTERDRAAASLRRHFAAGRLDIEELERRLALVVSARSRSELRQAFHALPSGRGRRVAHANRVALRAHAAAYAGGNGFLIGVWELTGGGEFWPAWALVPTTGLLAWHLGATYVARRLLRTRSAARP